MHPAIQAKKPERQKSKAAFRTISEVSTKLDVPQHVLRFWETKFLTLKPLKRGGGRRYYRPEDITLLQNIKNLLYAEGYTIKGVQRLLKGNKASLKSVPLRDVTSVVSTDSSETEKPAFSDSNRVILSTLLEELKALRRIIS